MKILNLSYDDYANYGHENANALRSVGIDVSDLKRVRHTFKYTSESEIVTSSIIEREIKKADIIQLFHSDSTWLDYARNLGKKIVVYHTGTTYRQNHEHCNTIFNNKVDACFTDHCEFIGLGMKNEQYVATAININAIHDQLHNVESNKISAPYKIGHFPSNPGVKGTNVIVSMINSLNTPKRFIYSENRVSYPDQLNRMDMCDIYVELFAPVQNGKQYGCYGVTAFEAAALAKVVFTNNVNEKAYNDSYGDCALIIANTEKDFINKMENILSLSSSKLLKLQTKTLTWVTEKHSLQASGKRLTSLLKNL